MPRKEAKYTNEIYEIVLIAEHKGISSTDIAKQLEIKSHSVKVPLVNLKRNNLIYSKTSFDLKKSGNPDARSVKYHATVYIKGMILTSKQLGILNKIRVGRKISEVGK